MCWSNADSQVERTERHESGGLPLRASLAQTRSGAARPPQQWPDPQEYDGQHVRVRNGPNRPRVHAFAGVVAFDPPTPGLPAYGSLDGHHPAEAYDDHPTGSRTARMKHQQSVTVIQGWLHRPAPDDCDAKPQPTILPVDGAE